MQTIVQLGGESRLYLLTYILVLNIIKILSRDLIIKNNKFKLKHMTNNINGKTLTEVQNIDATQFENEILKSDTPALVDFWAPWCQPCRLMAPVLDELNNMSEGKFKIAKVDVENPANQALAQEYEIMSIPNMKLFKNGKVIHEYIGLVDAKTLNNSICDAINRENWILLEKHSNFVQ